jgi:DNA-binding GntR family transcriptional regulator
LISGALLPHPSLSDQALSAVVDAITEGSLPPGARISEAQVARTLGISRGPLREALRRLEGFRLVERRRHLGVFVAGQSEEDLDDLFRMREVLEGAACGLAAARATDEWLAGMRGLLDQHSQKVSASGQYRMLSTDDDFHFRIVQQSGSRRLFNMLCSDLYLQIRLYRFRSSSAPGRAESALEEHHEIVAALETRDPARAESTMRRHIANARKHLRWSALPDGAATTNGVTT